MSDRDAFMRQIIATPEDASRLVFADWLDEYGDPARAEFIRVQCALADNDAVLPIAEVRERELLNRHRLHWLRELPRWARANPSFRRGFASVLKCTPGRWLMSAEQMARETLIQDIEVSPLSASRCRNSTWPAFVACA